MYCTSDRIDFLNAKLFPNSIYRRDVAEKLDLNAKPTMNVTDSWPASRAVALTRAKLCLAERTPTASRKSTPLGAAACPVSKKTVKQALAFPCATTSCAGRTPSASFPPLALRERRPHAPVSTATTATPFQGVPACRMSVPLHYLVRTLKSAFPDAARSAAKASRAELELVATRPPTSASVCPFSSAKRICSAFLQSSRPSVSHLAVATLTANTANLIDAFATPVRRAIRTNRAALRRRPVTQPNAVSMLNVVKESIESIVSAQLVTRATLTWLAKVSSFFFFSFFITNQFWMFF